MFDARVIKVLLASPGDVAAERQAAVDVIAARWDPVVETGSPTPRAESGTVEEITEFLDSGRQVHLFFSRQPLPHNADTGQTEAVHAFKDQMFGTGLVASPQPRDMATLLEGRSSTTGLAAMADTSAIIAGVGSDVVGADGFLVLCASSVLCAISRSCRARGRRDPRREDGDSLGLHRRGAESRDVGH